MKSGSLIAFIVALIALSLWFEFLIRSVLPVVYPIVLAGRFWISWLIMGLFIEPVMLLLAYAAIRLTNSKYNEWKAGLALTVLGFLYLTALAFVFSLIIPPDLEAFRTVALPAFVLTLTLILISRTKYAKRRWNRDSP